MALNIKNLKKLRKYLDTIKNSQVDQNRYSEECGAPACMAGHAVMCLGSSISADIALGFSEGHNLFLLNAEGWPPDLQSLYKKVDKSGRQRYKLRALKMLVDRIIERRTVDKYELRS